MKHYTHVLVRRILNVTSQCKQCVATSVYVDLDSLVCWSKSSNRQGLARHSGYGFKGVLCEELANIPVYVIKVLLCFDAH